MDRTFDRMPGHSFAPGRNPAETRLDERVLDWLMPGGDPVMVFALILCAACIIAVAIGRHIHHIRSKLHRQRRLAATRAAEAATAQLHTDTAEPPIVHRSARMARMTRRS